ncbi:maltase A3-like [Teleopsis dalmanni]|uniref:maltase A3-like n=1 Tax=Teleopsis dalmanni TaxID=139649 RepID=UPI000D32C2F3|nr:maltase A3-like [Teleopsis dalmanni]
MFSQLRRYILTTLLLIFCLPRSHWACTLNSGAQEKQKDWWQTGQFYQIYPRSFMDSDGDGIGDLKGVTSKLEYLKDIGVTAAWLSPIFTSPMVDFGYDISDFYDIQPEYGTMDDFRELIARAKELDLKIILDFVPNHSSNESEWFKKSVARERGYEDYYVWVDARYDENGNRIPPSNWLQAFRGSAWEWNEQRQQYYLHQFTVQQPDLNYRNPAVVNQMKRILRYWLEQGVAGFRCDAVPVLFEVLPDENGIYPDEEKSGLTNDPDDRSYLKLDLIENQPETIDMIYQWRQVMDDHQRIYGGDTRVLLIETYAPAWYTMQMYGNSTTEGAHLPFNFNLITELENGVSATKVLKAVDDWLLNMPAGRTANWVMGNHDRGRAATRFGPERVDAMNMLVMILPGASVTYQGDEIGMTDGDVSWEESKDPAACNTNSSIYQKYSRDPERTPFQWNTEKNAGFSTATQTWLPVADNYETVNVEVELAADRSHIKVYKSLVELRDSSKTLQYGDWKYKALNENIFVVKRYLSGSETIIYISNLGDSAETIDLTTNFDTTLPETMNIKISSVDSKKTEGSTLQLNNISLEVGEGLVLSTA